MVAVTRGVPAWLYHLRGEAGRWAGGGQEGGGKGGTCTGGTVRTRWTACALEGKEATRERTHLARDDRSSPFASAMAARKSSQVTAWSEGRPEQGGEQGVSPER